MNDVERVMALADEWRMSIYEERDAKESALRDAVESLAAPAGDEWFENAIALKERLALACRTLGLGGTAQQYKDADEAFIAHLRQRVLPAPEEQPKQPESDAHQAVNDGEGTDGSEGREGAALSAMRRALRAMELMESVYRQNCVTPTEPSSILENLQAEIGALRYAMQLQEQGGGQ